MQPKAKAVVAMAIVKKMANVGRRPIDCVTRAKAYMPKKAPKLKQISVQAAHLQHLDIAGLLPRDNAIHVVFDRSSGRLCGQGCGKRRRFFRRQRFAVGISQRWQGRFRR